jgi:hypothetical protein
MTTPIHVLVLSSRMVPIYFYGWSISSRGKK